jgi:hypothetical protein
MSGEFRRVFQALFEAQTGRFLHHAINQKVRTKRRIVHARQHRALRSKQLRQATQHTTIILGQQKTAFLERRRIDDHQIIRTAVDHLAPGLEQVVAEETHLAHVMSVHPMIVAATTQRRAGHIEVDHMARTAGNGRHGKTAGVGEQVQHAFAGSLLAHPVASVTHIEEQPGVLLAAQIDPVLQAAFDNAHLIDFFAQQPFGGALRQVTMLNQQGVRAGLLPLGAGADIHQQLLECFELLGCRVLEQRHQQHALQPVHRELFQARPATSAPVEQTAGFAWRRCEGWQQVGVEGGEGFRVHQSRSANKGAAF